jgi:hypothetical protein
MKYFLFIISLFYFGCSNCNTSTTQDSISKKGLSEYPFLSNATIKYVNVELPIYHIDSCLVNVIDSLIQDDLNCEYFNEEKSCYYFSILKMEKFYQIGVKPTYIDLIDSNSYVGVFYHKKRMFICYGDNTENLLHKTNNDSVSVQLLVKNFKSKNDSLNYIMSRNSYWGLDVPQKTRIIKCKNILLYFFANICTSNSNIKK